MPRQRFAALTALALAVLGASAARAAEPGATLQLQHCIDLALKNNVDVQIAQEAVEESRALRAAALSNAGPRVRLEGNLIRWNEPFKISFFGSGGGGVDPSQVPPPTTPYEMIVAGMLQGLGQPFEVRGQTTKSLSVTIAQPVSQLFSIFLAYGLQDEGYEASQLRHELSRREAHYRVTEAFLRVLQTKRLVAIAEGGLSTVDAHLAQAKKFYEAELIGRNDLLKAELGLANARGGQVQAKAQYALALANLSNLTGERISPEAAFEDPFGNEVPEFPGSLEQAKANALSTRLELRGMEKHLEQARTGRALAWAQFIPSISAVASYSHNEGSRFQEENAFFAGGTLSWDVWEWGGTYFQKNAAASKLNQAQLGLRKVRELMALEVERNFLEMQKARQNIAIAQASIALSDENLHVELARYDVHANTSTDVLDVQTAQQRVLSEHATAYYDYLVALENMKKSVGENPISNRARE